MVNFDSQVDRKNTYSLKWDGMAKTFGRDDLLPMWVADMDFRPPEEVTEALRERIDHGVFGYTISTAHLSGAIVDWLRKRHGWDVADDWLLYSPGVVPSIHAAIQAFSEPGDGVLLQSPVYTPFFHMIEKNGRKIINSPLVLKENQYEVDFADFERKLADGVKIFLMSSPHNPAGRVWTEKELAGMTELCRKHGVIIISDEIHADLVAAPNRHIPVASLSPDVGDMTITLMAPTKTFNLAGVQASFMVIPNKEMQAKVTEVQAREGISMLNTFGVTAMEAAYRHGHHWLDEALTYIRSNIELVKREVGNQLPKLNVIDPEGSYLVWIDCRETGWSDRELKKRLLDKGKLALNFGAAYGSGGEGFIRMNVACPRSIVEEGLKRLKEAFKE